MPLASSSPTRWILGKMASLDIFNSVGMFERQFTPTDGGYLIYPTKRSGGKLVTAEEYEILVGEWRAVAGSRGQLKTVGILIAAIVVWTLISTAYSLPEWPQWIVIVCSVVAISGRILWASFAPRRLVRDRPTVVPPLPMSQVKRESRALLNWPLVGFLLVFFGFQFLNSLANPQDTISWWAWTIFSGLLFGAYVWIAIQKLRDRKSDAQQ